MAIELRRLREIRTADIVALMSDPRVVRHMPLAKEPFDDAACARFVDGKEKQWEDNGYGPWAFVLDGVFAGWGGFQKEGNDADLALVLAPAWWGRGPELYRTMLEVGFRPSRDGGFGFESVIILLPPSRTRLKALNRMGFSHEGTIDYLGEPFLKFRLLARDAKIDRHPSDFS
jgi:ribosomal-protein-alanine N-acetyltransferase